MSDPSGSISGSYEPTLMYVLADDWRLIRDALKNYAETYPTCPCGAWIDQLEDRPHVIGCPVGAMHRRGFI